MRRKNQRNEEMLAISNKYINFKLILLLEVKLKYFT